MKWVKDGQGVGFSEAMVNGVYSEWSKSEWSIVNL
jgi:hypothetical protein